MEFEFDVNKSASNFDKHGINFEEAKKNINLFINQDIADEQKNKARLCLLKILIEEQNDDAKILLDTLKREIPEEEKSNHIILENLEALYHFQEGRVEKSLEILQNTAKNALTQDNFAKLLTLSNISIFLQSKEPEVSEDYSETIESIAKKLNYQNFLTEYKKHFN